MFVIFIRPSDTLLCNPFPASSYRVLRLAAKELQYSAVSSHLRTCYYDADIYDGRESPELGMKKYARYLRLICL